MKSMEDRMEETDWSVRGLVDRVTMLERAPLEEPHGQVGSPGDSPLAREHPTPMKGDSEVLHMRTKFRRTKIRETGDSGPLDGGNGTPMRTIMFSEL